MLSFYKTGKDKALDIIFAIAYAYKDRELIFKRLPIAEFNQELHKDDRVFHLEKDPKRPGETIKSNRIVVVSEKQEKVLLLIYD
ncbi:MAG: hypothetical protein ABDH18_02130 [Aquificaceae bacterium]